MRLPDSVLRALVRGAAIVAVPIGFAIPLAVQTFYAAHEQPTAPRFPGDTWYALYAALPFTGVAILAFRAHQKRSERRRASVVVGALAASVLISGVNSWAIWHAVYAARLGPLHFSLAMFGPVVLLVLVLAVGAASTRRGRPALDRRTPEVVVPGDDKRIWRYAFLATIIVCIVQMLVSIPACWFVPATLSIREAELQLQRPEVYGPTGERLALYCQSDRAIVPENIGPSYLPPPLRSRAYLRGFVTPTHAGLELGGGFYHFGYSLEKDPLQSTEDTSVWHLSRRAEEEPDQPLATIRIPASARVSREQLRAWQEEGYGERLAARPQSDLTHSSHVQALIRHGDYDGALRAADEWVAARPDAIIPRFTQAHLMGRLNRGDYGAQQLDQWVRAHPTFEHRCYLFIFYMREGRSVEALAAIRAALNEPLGGRSTGPFNDNVLARDAAFYALIRGESGLCIAVCDKALGADPESFRREFTLLKAAARSLRHEDALAERALAEAAAEGGANWRDRGQEEVLVAAIRSRNLGVVGDSTRWQDPNEDWATPFDEDETGMRGGDRDRLPNPYPSDWRRRVIEGRP